MISGIGTVGGAIAELIGGAVYMVVIEEKEIDGKSVKDMAKEANLTL